jgi:hypothetical protein
MKKEQLIDLLRKNYLFFNRVSKVGNCFLIYKPGCAQRLKERLSDIFKHSGITLKIISAGIKSEKEVFIAFELTRFGAPL